MRERGRERGRSQPCCTRSEVIDLHMSKARSTRGRRRFPPRSARGESCTCTCIARAALMRGESAHECILTTAGSTRGGREALDTVLDCIVLLLPAYKYCSIVKKAATRKVCLNRLSRKDLITNQQLTTAAKTCPGWGLFRAASPVYA